MLGLTGLRSQLIPLLYIFRAVVDHDEDGTPIAIRLPSMSRSHIGLAQHAASDTITASDLRSSQEKPIQGMSERR